MNKTKTSKEYAIGTNPTLTSFLFRLHYYYCLWRLWKVHKFWIFQRVFVLHCSLFVQSTYYCNLIPHWSLLSAYLNWFIVFILHFDMLRQSNNILHMCKHLCIIIITGDQCSRIAFVLQRSNHWWST